MVVTESSGDETVAQRHVRVFLSYAHNADSDHQDMVRTFWVFLRTHGIDAHMDIEAEGQRQDWALWMANEIRLADHILVIASSAYRMRAQGHSGHDVGRGVQWEARLIRDLVYRNPGQLDRFVPVILPGQTIDGVPDYLAPATTSMYYVKEFSIAGAESLLRLLTRQPPHPPRPLGPPPHLPPRAPSHPPSGGHEGRAPAGRHSRFQPAFRHRLWVSVATLVAIVVWLTLLAVNADRGNGAHGVQVAETRPTTTKPTPAGTRPTVAATMPPATSTQSTAPPTPTRPSPPSTFTGRGDDVVAIDRPSGLKIIRFECPRCGGNTVIHTNGSENLLVNTIGPYSGQQWADIHDGSNTTKITIEADSGWTLAVGGIDMAQVVTGAASGHGDDVVLLNSHTSQATISNQGQANFIVLDVPSAGGSENFDINTIGAYHGTVPLAGPALVQITSDGSWSLTPS